VTANKLNTYQPLIYFLPPPQILVNIYSFLTLFPFYSQLTQVSLLHRQQLEMRGAVAQDEIYRSLSDTHTTPNPRMIFRYEEVFTTAVMFDGMVDKMIASYQPEQGISHGMKTLLNAITEGTAEGTEEREKEVQRVRESANIENEQRVGMMVA
jgi:hypothetical protein